MAGRPPFGMTGSIVCLVAAMAFPIEPLLAQRLGQGEDPGISLLRIFGALLLCLALGMAAILVIRARTGGRLPQFVKWKVRDDARLKLVESVRAGPGTNAALVRVDEHEFLVISNQGAVSVTEVPQPSAPRRGPK